MTFESCNSNLVQYIVYVCGSGSLLSARRTALATVTFSLANPNKCKGLADIYHGSEPRMVHL